MATIYHVCSSATLGVSVFSGDLNCSATVIGRKIDMQIQEYTQTARELLDGADRQFSSGDTMHGSEKLWGAAAHAVMTVAQERGWAYGNPNALKTAVGKLIREHDAPELRGGFAAAQQFHANFYHGLWRTMTLRSLVPLVHDFVERVLSYA